MITYSIEIFSRGLEVGIGKISKEQYEFWSDRDEEELGNALNQNIDYDDEYPESVRFNEYYNEYSDVACAAGPDADNSTLVIKDEEDNEVYNDELQSFFNEETGNNENFYEQNGIWQDDLEPGYYVYWVLGGKGTYFDGEIETEKFDPKKLVIKTDVVNGHEVVTVVEYDGREVDNSGGDWWGKWAEYSVFEIEGE
jgi:hypothetical protein